MEENKLYRNLKILYFISFGALACFYPFLTYYFQEKGLTFTQIGIAFAVFSITGVLTQPIWGFITDKYSNKKTTLMITMILSSIAVYSFIFAENFYIVILSIILFLSFQSSIIPVGDAMSYEIIEHHRKFQYGKIRLMGSAGYAFSALFCGQIIKRLGTNFAFIFYSIIILIGVYFVYKIDFKGKQIKNRINLYDIADVIKDKRFVVFMISICIASISIGANNAYISLLIQKTGGGVAQLGMLGFIVALSELPSLFFGTKLLKKYGELNLFMLGMAFFIMRYFLDSICTSYVSVLLVQAMQGISFSLFLMSSYQYLNKIIPSKMRTSAMTLYAAVCGFGNFIGNIGGGMLLEEVSIFILFKVISIVCVLSLCTLIILKNINKVHIKEMYISG